MYPPKYEIHSLLGHHTLKCDWSILIITHCLAKISRTILNPPSKHLINCIVLVLQEEARLILLGKSEIRDLVVLCENDATIKRIGLILNDIMEAFNAIIHVLALILGSRVARLVLEIARVAVLKQEPRLPPFERVLIFDGSAAYAITEWIEYLKLGLVEIARVALSEPAECKLRHIGIDTGRREQ